MTRLPRYFMNNENFFVYSSRKSARTRLPWLRLLTVAACMLLGGARMPMAADAKPDEANQAWNELERATQPPRPPAEWQTKEPSAEEIAKFQNAQGKLAAEAADKAKDFYTRFAADPRADDARQKELEMTGVAVELGLTNRLARLEELEQGRLKDPKLTDDEKFQIRAGAVQRAARLREAEGIQAVLAEFEKGARALLKDFPKRPEIYGMLMMVASESEGEKSRKLAQELIDSPAPEEIKEAAKALIKKMDALGRPLAIQFAAVDGRDVDLTKLKGKVVLVDFWATWCGPCVKELPNVKAAYDKLHEKGFEIVGISFDQQKDKLESFVKREKMAWPQYFDGKGWGNKFGQEFGIQSIPSMWLVDKKGNLRDMNARPGLAEKVEKLLAEKE